MDTLTHALIGANIAGLAGHSISMTDPVFLGPVLASMAPDLDIVMQVKGDLAYIKSHRGISHSLPSLLILSGIITVFLHSILPTSVPVTTLFAVTAAGALSHSLFDMLNSYGVKLLWPLYRSKVTCSILSLVDWFIIAFSLITVAAGAYHPNAYWCWTAVITGYLLYRKWTAKRMGLFLARSFRGDGVQKVVVMPARFQIFLWDFLLETRGQFVIGTIHSFSLGTKILRQLKKTKDNLFIKAALESKLGKLFREFTPHFYVMHKKKGCSHLVQFTDLRYYNRTDFMHTGTVFLDEQCCAIEQVFQPYNRNHRVIVG
ncbi:MAG: metal-dependent hydrolase [Bacillota bacterium]